jgi:hypothetical protein
MNTVVRGDRPNVLKLSRARAILRRRVAHRQGIDNCASRRERRRGQVRWEGARYPDRGATACICIGAAAARHVAHRVGSASGRVAFALIIDCAGGLQNCGGALPVRPVTSSLESGRRESMKLPKRKHLHGIPWEAQAKVAVKARTKAASTRTRGCRCPATPRRRWSGRPESNRRRPAWEAGILPLNYARVSPRSLVSRPGGCQWSASPQNLGSRGGAERRGSATRRGRRPGAPRPRSLVQGLPRSIEPTPKAPRQRGPCASPRHGPTSAPPSWTSRLGPSRRGWRAAGRGWPAGG